MLTYIIAGAAYAGHLHLMDDPADTLRRRIALYRTYLAEGVDSELAAILLYEIVEAENKLRSIVSEEPDAEERGRLPVR
jgi:hypothetical protein